MAQPTSAATAPKTFRNTFKACALLAYGSFFGGLSPRMRSGVESNFVVLRKITEQIMGLRVVLPSAEVKKAEEAGFGHDVCCRPKKELFSDIESEAIKDVIDAPKASEMRGVRE
ncbi:hypothetical protein S7711_10416 [Stachybotrys chartarum IBT 7711]|uniref:Uncharacterized protein n=1 Tax=Stachybotrys chartarum (strain CBS 109288 / IBT 7711) TaxID=1280523 RepID=A0A084B4A8_STACB|nr:hypothetical protein S7711_10416 [Stachybotrys chartarum IBT 7711]KFA54350.1 hypothetical protein S40293_10858 [Stachybotrys chartarum IBT 40293]KFA74430.1 hypothetical protein S40288_10861 [Stachybotrys chartarum IBT 40288]